MGLLARLARIFRPAAALSRNPPEWGLRYLPVYDAGVPLSSDAALQVSAVYACVDVITRAIAPAPWLVYRVEKGTRQKLPDDPTAYLLNTRANPETTAIAVREALLYSALISGNGYAEIQRDRAGRVAALWPIEPDRVVPRRDADTGEFFYEVTLWNGGAGRLPARDMFHLRGPSLMGFVGDNVVYRASKAIAVAAAAQQFSAAYFANGTVVSGVLEYPGVMDQATLKRLKTDWEETHKGKWHKPVILENGMTWKPLSSEPDRAQLLETRRFAVAEICRFFGVPLHKVADPQGAQGYGSNLEASEQQWAVQCLAPWTRRLEQEADFKLLPGPPWRESRVDLSRLHQGDFKTRMEGYAIARKSGVLNQNEIREAEGWNTVGTDGNVFLVEASMATLENVIKAETYTTPEPTGPGVPPEEETGEEEPAEKGGAAARAAVALDRFARRLQARRADLSRHAPDKVEANLASERRKLEPGLISECCKAYGLEAGNGFDVRVLKAASAVLEGEPPHLAAARLLEIA